MSLPTFEQQHGHPTDVSEGWFDTLAKTVAVDFDGVLHPYTKGWTGSVPDDEEPTPGTQAFLSRLAHDGYRVVVFSTRADHEEGKAGIERWLTDWGLRHLVDEVTHTKPPAVVYLDDRAVPFTGDWLAAIDGIERLARGRAHGAA